MEIFGFILMCRWVGIIGTLLLFVATTALGGLLLRQRLVVHQQSIKRLTIVPGEHLRFLAAFLLILPGFITDLIGLLLLVPLLQQVLLSLAVTSAKRRSESKATQTDHPKGRVFEGEYRREDNRK